MLTLSPDIRLKHTLKLARPCFADHSSEGEALVALWKSSIIRKLPWSQKELFDESL